MFLRKDFKAISENLNSKLVVMEEAKQYNRSPTGKVWVKREEAFDVIVAF